MTRMTLNNITMTETIHDLFTSCCSTRVWRRIPSVGTYSFAYGEDHACGYFVQFFPLDDIAKVECDRICGFEDSECVDIDSMFFGLLGSDYQFIVDTFLEQKGKLN